MLRSFSATLMLLTAYSCFPATPALAQGSAQVSPALVAALRPNEPLFWKRISPAAGTASGPVLYQIIFRSNAQPGFIPKISSTFSLTNSLLSDTGSALIIGGLSIAADGTISFKPGQSFPILGTGGGTVTSITAGTGLTGGIINTSGTIALNTVFTDGRYLMLSGGTLSGALTATSATSGATLITAKTTDASSAASIGLYAESDSTSANAIFALAAASGTTNYSNGVFAQSNSANGAGVYGKTIAAASGATAVGVYGDSSSPSGAGVYAINQDTSSAGAGNGVYGQTASPHGAGVYGLATDASFVGATSGVYGQTVSPFGAGLYGNATDTSDAGSATGVIGQSASPSGYGVFGHAMDTTAGSAGLLVSTGVLGQSDSLKAIGVKGSTTDTHAASAGEGVLGITSSPNGSGVVGVASDTTGAGTAAFPKTVGIYGIAQSLQGTAGLLDNQAQSCNGNSACRLLMAQANSTTLFSVRGDGHVHAASFDAGGADFAESVAVRGERRSYAPGDVLVIDGSGLRRLRKSQGPYSALVAGIVSTQPGVLASQRNGNDASYESQIAREVPLAIVGIVPCKVTAENGPIQPGDLLVTAFTPGYAMRGTDRRRMLGAVLGKAMQPLASGQGVVEVLLTLQ